MGGNLIVDLDEDDYKRGIKELKYIEVGKLYLNKGIEVPTTMDLKAKMSRAWGFQNLKVVPMGGSYHHVVMRIKE